MVQDAQRERHCTNGLDALNRVYSAPPGSKVVGTGPHARPYGAGTRRTGHPAQDACLPPTDAVLDRELPSHLRVATRDLVPIPCGCASADGARRGPKTGAKRDRELGARPAKRSAARCLHEVGEVAPWRAAFGGRLGDSG